AYHGVALLLFHVGLWPRLPRLASVALNFLIVVAGWVMFRAASFGQARAMYRAMLGGNGLGLSWPAHHVAILGFLAVVLAVSLTIDTYDVPMPRRRAWTALAAAALVFCVLGLAGASPFLSFQF